LTYLNNKSSYKIIIIILFVFVNSNTLSIIFIKQPNLYYLTIGYMILIHIY